MTTSQLRDESLGTLLDEVRVPGAVAALYAGGETMEASGGVCNLDTGVAVTRDTLFQIGSITKLFTATLVLGLAEAGHVQIDSPVADYIPAFKERYPAVTVRQLLTHTSGLQGDHFADLGDGDDCIERYTACVAELEPLHSAGERYSYCNAGFSVAGHIVERIAGEPWHAALRSRLVEPAGLRSCVTLPEEALLHRVAVGHVLDREQPAGPIRRAPRWYFGRATGPAGAICATAADLLAFGRVVLDGGRISGRERLISADSVASMIADQIGVPQHVGPGLRAIGLAWRLYDWQGTRVLGHDGSTLGQHAVLRVVPERGLVAALLTNGPDGKALFRRVFERELMDRWGIRMPKDAPRTSPAGVRSSRYVGTYESLNRVVHVELDGETLIVSLDISGPLADTGPRVARQPLVRFGNHAFTMSPWGLPAVTVVFTDFDDGNPQWLYVRGRAHRRIA